MSLSEQVLLMKQSLSEVEEHLNKLQGGRKASSAKSRAILMKLKKDSHKLRSDITKYTKGLPTKTRTKKPVAVVEEEPVEVKKKARTKRTKKPVVES